ncbi:hypothetical protein FRACA_2850009 [Frankia canadensis]|uniref:Uncharacterized protein n=1 Tax=Frankia canadensis TaxID=1836972 RepID=A0A2I2KT77_9ACTN|nr:hypothetical protein FRACA_2850009 [Frankia canadensis]SOU56152.1 hypothetical protein FRACA_2850009 [Frankia canadensis]
MARVRDINRCSPDSPKILAGPHLLRLQSVPTAFRPHPVETAPDRPATPAATRIATAQRAAGTAIWLLSVAIRAGRRRHRVR